MENSITPELSQEYYKKFRVKLKNKLPNYMHFNSENSRLFHLFKISPQITYTCGVVQISDPLQSGAGYTTSTHNGTEN